jgi:hypothetical protein
LLRESAFNSGVELAVFQGARSGLISLPHQAPAPSFSSQATQNASQQARFHASGNVPPPQARHDDDNKQQTFDMRPRKKKAM